MENCYRKSNNKIQLSKQDSCLLCFETIYNYKTLNINLLAQSVTKLWKHS